MLQEDLCSHSEEYDWRTRDILGLELGIFYDLLVPEETILLYYVVLVIGVVDRSDLPLSIG